MRLQSDRRQPWHGFYAKDNIYDSSDEYAEDDIYESSDEYAGSDEDASSESSLDSDGGTVDSGPRKGRISHQRARDRHRRQNFTLEEQRAQEKARYLEQADEDDEEALPTKYEPDQEVKKGSSPLSYCLGVYTDDNIQKNKYRLLASS